MNDSKPHYLYKTTNTLNGKIYIGVSVDPVERFDTHCANSKGSAIGNAIRKHARESFKLDVLVCGRREYVYELEAKAIQSYDTVAPKGYNIATGGVGGHAGCKRSDETRAKLSAQKRGKASPLKGKPMSEQGIANVRLARKVKMLEDRIARYKLVKALSSDSKVPKAWLDELAALQQVT
jgi:group I intron endonuclease